MLLSSRASERGAIVNPLLLTITANICQTEGEIIKVNTMATMNISLPDPMRDWVEIQVEGGRYSNNSDYVRDLIRRDQECNDKLKALQSAITKGINSGKGGALDMDEIKRLAREQAGLDAT